MKRTEDQIKEYYRSIQPSEDFSERLLKLEAKKTPQTWTRIAAAAAACLALGFIGWKLLGLEQGNPHLVLPTEPPAQTEMPEETNLDTEAVSPGASEAQTGQDPTEIPTQPGNDAAEPSEEAPAVSPTEDSTEPTVTQPTQPTQPPAPTEEATPTETAPPSMIAEPGGSTQPPVQPTEPTPERHITGWYDLEFGRSYVCLQDEDTGEIVRYDVTGLLTTGYYKMTVQVFGLTLEVELVGDPQEETELSDGLEPEGWFDVYVTIR